jgi:TetR/AcrR family transcriptional regulator, transcriptional repressor for nem operon
MPRPKSFDEDTVLDQAVQLFWERGYDGTSLADLEAHLGLGRQSLYNSFGDKQALFLKALDRYERHAGAAVDQLAASDAGLEAIRRFFHWAVDSQTAPGPRRGCLLNNTICEIGGADAEVQLRSNRARDTLARAFRRALTRAKAREEVPRDLDVEATATLLVVQNYGLNILGRTGTAPAELHAAVEALLAGLR